jgi:thiol-disulfide isomerase/thioredoxin
MEARAIACLGVSPRGAFLMRYVFCSFRVGILLIAPAMWFVLIVGPGAAQSEVPAGAVELRDVKYDGLVEAVRAQRGKVVVVDVWGDFCIPCKLNYPHLIELHQKYGSQGLVCLSVSLDRSDSKPKALAFLKKMNSTIANYWLDETPAVWGKRWDIQGPPVIFVFDRAGRRAGKFGTEEKPVEPEAIEKLVTGLLQGKT